MLVYHIPEIGILSRTYFCGGSSARLPSTSHVHKMNSRPGITISAASHFISYLFEFHSFLQTCYSFPIPFIYLLIYSVSSLVISLILALFLIFFFFISSLFPSHIFIQFLLYLFLFFSFFYVSFCIILLIYYFIPYFFYSHLFFLFCIEK